MNSSEADPGRILVNRYRLDEIIGAGGMGRVWRGTDTLLGRTVAVKELTTPPNLPPHEVEVLRTRMIREARSAAQLSHPAIITVFDVAEEDGRPWIVMELVRGPSLGDIIKEDGVLDVRRAANIGEQMAAGLAEAHDRGIVHRDIKPGNVLIAGNDRAVLTDFGIAHLDGSTHLTSTGLLIGSPSYLAPEIAHGHSATSASDMWALGITLYQAVEGGLPFDRPTPMATLTAIVTQELPETPNAGALRPVLEALTEKRPEDRPSVLEVRSLLREIRDSGGADTTAVASTLAPAEPALEPADPGAEPDWNKVTNQGTVDRAVGAATETPAVDESHVAHVADPAGGSYAVERLTDDLAVAAWNLFGRIEDGADLDEHVYFWSNVRPGPNVPLELEYYQDPYHPDQAGTDVRADWEMLLNVIEEILDQEVQISYIGRSATDDYNTPDELLEHFGSAVRMIGAGVRNTINPTMLEAGYKQWNIQSSAYVACSPSVDVRSRIPGETVCPPRSRIRASLGTATDGPTASMSPLRITIVPRSMTPRVTV